MASMTARALRVMSSVLTLWAVIGCDPAIGAGIAVAPRPGIPPDSVKRVVYSTARMVAKNHNLVPETAAEDVTNMGWDQCFRNGGLRLCGKSADGTVQLLIAEFPRLRFTPRADSLRRELFDSLRTRFDTPFVRRCTWNSHKQVCASR